MTINLTEIVRKTLNYNGFYDVDINRVLNDPLQSLSIIKMILQRRDKADSFIVDSGEFKKNKSRAPHMLITYSLGCFIIENYFNYFLENINKIKLYGNIDNLLHAWLITSLFHDIGYYHKVEYTESSIKKYLDSQYSFSNFHCTYNSRTVFQYFLLRKNGYLGEDELMDHGICGGFYVNHSLQLKYHQMAKKLNAQNIDYFVNYETNVFYSNEDLEMIRDASCAIAQHNLFKPQADMFYYYEAFQLFELMDNQRKVNHADLLNFVLCLVDTIDISKKLDENYCSACDCLWIDYDENSLIISLNLANNNIEFDINYYYNLLLSLKDWINVTTNSTSNGVKIKIC